MVGIVNYPYKNKEKFHISVYFFLNFVRLDR